MHTSNVLILMNRVGIGVQMRTLQRWCKTGKLPAKKVGGDWYVDMERLKSADESEGGPELYEELVMAINREAS